MRLGIDLHNIRDGGGISYMSNLLRTFDPARHGFDAIVLFGAEKTLALMPDSPAIEKRSHWALSQILPFRVLYSLFLLTRELFRTGCDVAYFPGGLYFGRFRPFVSISRNMLPFQQLDWASYGPTWDLLRLAILRWAHASTFRRADAMIFLTKIAQDTVGRQAGVARQSWVVPHGVNRDLFRSSGNRLRPPPASDRPIELVYPSRLEPYKHQVEVIEAVRALRARFPRLRLTLCGPANANYLKKVRGAIAACDPHGDFLTYIGVVDQKGLPELYDRSDLMIFASSCENLPNTVLEAMASGIPMVCSSSPPMPEVARDAAVYFDPADPASIEAAVAGALTDWKNTQARVARGQEHAAQYSWDRCADLTFDILSRTAN